MPANFQLSPGVAIVERDLTTTTNVQQGNVGAIAGPYRWGPVNKITEVSDENELSDRYGKPDDYNYETWFSGAQFLNYGGLLKVVRTDSPALLNAVSNGAGTAVTSVKITNEDDYEQSFYESSNNWEMAVKYPGTWGNSIRTFITDAGADQILALPAPASGNEWEFTSNLAISGVSGAGAKVFTYRIRFALVAGFTGTPTPGSTATITIGGSAQAVNLIGYDATNRIVEITIPSAGVTGIIGSGQVVAQSGVGFTGTIEASTIVRELLTVTNVGATNFIDTDSVIDDNTITVAIDSVRTEYFEREYLPGQKWVNIAPRPSTTRFAQEKGAYRDEIHIITMDYDGGITGTPYQLLEKFLGLSKASDAKSTVGESNFYPEVLKSSSAYILWGEHPADNKMFVSGADLAGGAWGLTIAGRTFNLLRVARGPKVEPSNRTGLGSTLNSTLYYDFGGGVDYQISNSEYQFTQDDLNSAYSLYQDVDTEVVNFIIGGAAGTSVTAGLAKIAHLSTIAETRKDCMAFFSPIRSAIIGRTDGDVIASQIVSYFDQAPSSSYVVYDSGYKYIYDKYNDKYRYIPCNADVAGLTLNTALTAEPWFSPAGYQRGNIRNSIRLAFSPKKDQRDKLYSSRVNPIVTFPGQGTVLFGDKTGLGYASAFDRINVRRLFIVIEKVIGEAAKTILFEQNDEITRTSFIGLVEPYMRDVQGRRGVIDFLVKCNSSNNPQDAVDRGEFYAEIYIKPTRSINYVTLTFTATRTGVSFAEVAN